MYMIRIKRIYEPSAMEDGYRVLVDRLWPRGVSKEKANIDEWVKNIAPSTELRKEFHSDTSLVESFRYKYINELSNNEAAVSFSECIKKRLADDNVTFLTASKNEGINHTVILKEWIEKKSGDRCR